MLFPTVEFALFFLLVFTASWIARPWPVVYKGVLLVASYVFYGWWDYRFTLLLGECTLVNYVLGLAMDGAKDESRRRLLLTVAVVFNLGVLGFFKYWGFFLSSVNDGLHAAGIHADVKIMEVILPVGISFYTFQGISYIMDIYRGQIRAVTSLLDMMLFKSFFPQLVAGPIVRASEFLPQLAKPQGVGDIRATRAFLLIALGLVKKVVIAHYLAAELVNPIFESPKSFGTLDLLFGAYGYAMQIYCDFSAYSDMAIGVALLFGYEFPRNFDQPYRSRSLQEFWRRWHQSLSGFLRDYLYIPLGGSRDGAWRTYRNLFLTMVLGGLWHGAAWTFVIWGALHGSALCVERYVAGWRRRRLAGTVAPELGGWRRGTVSVLQGILVFHFVCLTWIFFNADSLTTALSYLKAMARLDLAPHMLTPFVFILLLVAAAGQLIMPDLIDRLEDRAARTPLAIQAAFLGLAMVAVTACGPGALAPFIYFKF